VDRGVRELAFASEAAPRQLVLDRVAIRTPGDEVDVRVVARNAPEQKLERPAAAEPERDLAGAERVGDLLEKSELASGRGVHGADDTHYEIGRASCRERG